MWVTATQVGLKEVDAEALENYASPARSGAWAQEVFDQCVTRMLGAVA